MINFTLGQYSLITAYSFDIAKAFYIAGAITSFFNPQLSFAHKAMYNLSGTIFSLIFFTVALQFKKIEGAHT